MAPVLGGRALGSLAHDRYVLPAHASELEQDWVPERVTEHYGKVPPYKDPLAQCPEEPKLAECVWGQAAVRACCLQTSMEEPPKGDHGRGGARRKCT